MRKSVLIVCVIALLGLYLHSQVFYLTLSMPTANMFQCDSLSCVREQALRSFSNGSSCLNCSALVSSWIAQVLFERGEYAEARKWYLNASQKYQVAKDIDRALINAAICEGYLKTGLKHISALTTNVLTIKNYSSCNLPKRFWENALVNFWENYGNLSFHTLQIQHKLSNQQQLSCVDPMKMSFIEEASMKDVFWAAKIKAQEYENHNQKQKKIKTKNNKMFIHKRAVIKNASNSVLNIGYLSGDFKNHALGLQVCDMFAFHSVSAFNITCYSTTQIDMQDIISQRIHNSCKQLSIVTGTAHQIARVIYEDRIDILIDLSHYTAGHRHDVLALRPSPIQITYLGLAATTGSSFIDYYIVDHIVVNSDEAKSEGKKKKGKEEINRRKGETKWFSEALVFMPHSYHILNHRNLYGQIQRVPPALFDWVEIPHDKFLFCSLGRNVKINPMMFDVWANILNDCPQSVLVLRDAGNESVKWLTMEAVARNLHVSPNLQTSQVIFLRAFELENHVRVKSLCDVYLDTYPMNGHSTTADMLYAGVPMITLTGQTMASRVSASFATTLGLKRDMVVESYSDYHKFALELFLDRQKLLGLKKKLQQAIHISPLYDAQLWVQTFEQGLEVMWQGYLNHTLPRTINLEDFRLLH